MPRYIDRMNLPQYCFFNNMLQQEEERQEMVADILAAGHQMKHGNRRGFMEAANMLAASRNKIADFLYVLEEDKERCRKSLKAGNIRRQQKQMEQYADILLMLHVFQGASYNKERAVSREQAGNLPEREISRRYRYDSEKGCYFKKVMSIPKLVLINGSLFDSYLCGEFTEKERRRLEGIMADDVHYIVNVQSESQGETAYLVERGKEEKIVASILDRKKGLRRAVPVREGMDMELNAVALSLLDYLHEVAEAEKKRRRMRQGGTPGYGKRQASIPRYIDENSIKVFDIRGTDGHELSVHWFRKKKGGTGDYGRAGYEMAPHTRRGHYRTCKSGKTVYVKPSIIHKERFDRIQSAHRINESRQKK